MANYITLSKEISERIESDRKEHVVNPYAFKNEDVVRRNMDHDMKNLLVRPSFVRDCEKIMHIPYYNRYSDKTQVFSLYNNDDISRRAQHVQLVSRIARNIGSLLGLNIDLIEAIALGHDIGHTPFGHAGERHLSELYQGAAGKYFNHNIQSFRVLDVIFPLNISLQTLDGIICHNGELVQDHYEPVRYNDFAKLDERVASTYKEEKAGEHFVPATLEACVVRISDIIAYLGKDRQDAIKIGLLKDMSDFSNNAIGSTNAEIINNMIVNIVENSYGKGYISMNQEFYEALRTGKKKNSDVIYKNKEVNRAFDDGIYPMLDQIFEKLLKDMKEHNKESLIYKHHIEYINDQTRFYKREIPYEEFPAEDIVVDYIASMTDDYFLELYKYLFPSGKYDLKYHGYFE